jgi:hypothetical protein
MEERLGALSHAKEAVMRAFMVFVAAAALLATPTAATAKNKQLQDRVKNFEKLVRDKDMSADELKTLYRVRHPGPAAVRAIPSLSGGVRRK